MQDELCKADERQLDGEHLAEGPVVCSIGEGVQGPLLQHAAGDHVALDLFEDISEDLEHTSLYESLPMFPGRWKALVLQLLVHLASDSTLQTSVSL